MVHRGGSKEVVGVVSVGHPAIDKLRAPKREREGRVDRCRTMIVDECGIEREATKEVLPFEECLERRHGTRAERVQPMMGLRSARHEDPNHVQAYRVHESIDAREMIHAIHLDDRTATLGIEETARQAYRVRSGVEEIAED